MKCRICQEMMKENPKLYQRYMRAVERKGPIYDQELLAVGATLAKEYFEQNSAKILAHLSCEATDIAPQFSTDAPKKDAALVSMAMRHCFRELLDMHRITTAGTA